MLEYLKPTAILLSADPGAGSTNSCNTSDEEDNVLDDMLGGGSSSQICKFAAGSTGSGDDSGSEGLAIFS